MLSSVLDMDLSKFFNIYILTQMHIGISDDFQRNYFFELKVVIDSFLLNSPP